jgi:dihydropyrimidinase
MSDFDLIISGGTVATASDTFKADVGIRGGRIVALAEGLSGAAQTIDAAERLVLPGGIDSHVHIAQPSGPGIVMADDFESATRSAAFGGNTMVMPFCLQPKDASIRETRKGYHALADSKCTSYKVFMTYQDLAPQRLRATGRVRVGARDRRPGMVHAENYDAIRFLTDRLEEAGKMAP